MKIKKGKHRPFLPAIGLYINKKEISRTVKFDSSAKYDIGSNQLDINKLFGIGYFPSHHQNSARFGWRYNPATFAIDLFAYIYDNGKRLSSASTELFIATLTIGDYYDLKIKIEEDKYVFSVDGIHNVSVPKTHNKKWGYKLGLYFGGDETAPQDITVSIS